MSQLLAGAAPYRSADCAEYLRRGLWRGLTLGDCLDRASDMHPDREAFVDQRSRYTYGGAREIADRLALGLLQRGVNPLDRVLIQLPNWNEFVFAYFACQKIGAIPVLLIDRYRQFEINRILHLTGATAWVVPRETEKVDFAPIIRDVLKDHPQLRTVITVRGALHQSPCVALERLVNDTSTSAARFPTLAHYRPHPQQIAHMGPTGGTTGEPKIVPRTHDSLICAVEFCSLSWDQHCEDVNMIVGPIGHDLSFTKGLLGSVITQGKTVFQESRDAADICRTIQQERVTSIICVPTLAQRLVQYEGAGHFDLASLRKLHIGGGAGLPGMVDGLIDRFNVRVYSGYGGTEGMTTITRAHDGRETISNTVGRPTSPYDSYKVVDSNGVTLPPNRIGELLVKGPCMFSGYYNDPATNAAVFDDDGFFRTGDLARIDANGYITLAGRRKEMINRGGESISATDIERLINLHPCVAAVAVVPMPDPIMGERACAYIEPKPNETLTPEDVISFLKEQKAAVVQFPERIELIDRIPVTMTGKFNKQALQQDIADKLLRSEAAERA